MLKKVSKIITIIFTIYEAISAFVAAFWLLITTIFYNVLSGPIISAIQTAMGEDAAKDFPTELVGTTGIIVAVCLIFAAVVCIVCGILCIIFGKRAIASYSTEMTIANGVLCIIFVFIPAGILYIVTKCVEDDKKVEVVNN